MGSWNKNKYKKYDPSKEGYGNADNWRESFKDRMNAEDKKNGLLIDNPEDKKVDELFGVVENLQELKRTYRKLVFEYHPDKIGHNEENNAFFAKITEKYKELEQQFS